MPVILRFDGIELLKKVLLNIRKPLMESHARIVQEIIDLYYDTISIVTATFPIGVHYGAVRTDYFRQSVRERYVRHAATTFESIIASDAPYSLIVDEGWTNRARGQESYPGRHPAMIAAESAVLIIGTSFDVSFAKYFGRF